MPLIWGFHPVLKAYFQIQKLRRYRQNNPQESWQILPQSLWSDSRHTNT